MYAYIFGAAAWILESHDFNRGRTSKITETPDISLIQNYIAISIKLNEKIDLNLSKAEIIHTKDKLSKAYLVKFTPGGNKKL